MKIDKYRNPWYKHNNAIYGPEWYTVENWYRVKEYQNYYLIEKTSQIDVVKEVDGVAVCISQVGSIRYAKAFIDHDCVHGDYRELK